MEGEGDTNALSTFISEHDNFELRIGRERGIFHIALYGLPEPRGCGGGLLGHHHNIILT